MHSSTNDYPVVGRHPDVDLTKYTVKIHGRDVIDYEKLEHDEPQLYREIVDQELEWNRLADIEEEKAMKNFK